MSRVKAVAYCRVSTDGQVDDGVSLQAQQHRVRAYAEAFDIEIIDIVTDAGISARNLRRPGLERALSLLDNKSADALLVAKLDRLTRSVKDLGTLLEQYFAADASALISVSENIDTATAGGRLVLHVLVSVGQWEREAVAERTREALAHLIRNGLRLGAVPLGLRYAPERDADGHRMIEAAPDEQRVLARIQALRTAGHSMRAIADKLTTEGWPTKRGCKWHRTTIERVLRRL